MQTQEVIKFNAEIDKVLHLMIHSLYTNKDIFLRELIANASDACDKLRYQATIHSNLLSDAPLKIKISVNKTEKILVVEDNGIGMNRDELIQNLGTIASSGTQKFLQHATGNQEADLKLIGQFGVGFYSVFMVADEVIVESRKAGEEQVWLWSSKGVSEFTVDKIDSDRDFGTKITLRMKDSEVDLLDRFKINHIISTYADHISIPIEFTDLENNADKAKVLNSSSALWLKSRSEISEEDYNQFYKKIAHAGDSPWLVLHNRNEGALSYMNLLFIPSAKTFDLFHPDRKRSVKLYIKRVFINDEGVDIIPQYMRFLRGVVDSEDLPLNISRETLQHNRILTQIKQSLTTRVLGELEKKLKKDRDSYLVFWNNFGSVLKEGLCEGLQNSEQLLNVCLFKSLKHNKYITIDEYIADMVKGQNEVFYITGEEGKIESHPQLDGFKERNIDVLLLSDTVDDFWVNNISSHQEKQLKSITRSDIDIKNFGDTSENQDTQESREQSEASDHLVIEYFKNVLGSNVKNVKVSKKLTNIPVCLVSDEGSMDIRMERFLIEQKQLKAASAKVLEINADHTIIKMISAKLSDKTNNNETDELVKLLFDQACVIEGEPVVNSTEFSRRLNDIIAKVLS